LELVVLIYVPSLQRRHWYEFKHAIEIGMGNMSSPILNRVLAGKRPLGRPMSRFECSIKVDLKWVGRMWTVLICLGIGTSGGLL